MEEAELFRSSPRRRFVTLAERITHEVESLPEFSQREVLDFVEFLKAKHVDRDAGDWTRFSMEQAIRGMEDEPDLYSEADVRRGPA